MNKPFSESCVQNQSVILDIIKPLLRDCHQLLEIGSGTGQHAVYFTQAMPHLQWQTSDRSEYHQGIQSWIDGANHKKLLNPIALDVSKDVWPSKTYDAIFTANTLHIMSKKEVASFFENLPSCLHEKSLVLAYGPFNIKGQYTSLSNERFDAWLHSNDLKSGIKDFEWINKLAEQAGLILVEDYAMPANNQILYWRAR